MSKLTNFNKSSNLSDNLIKLISFQDEEVLKILKRDKIYRADINKSRELNDYSEDVEQLCGMTPIWCFKGVSNNLTRESFTDGCLFERYRCEMSVSREYLSNLLCLEIDYKGNPRVGKTHNAYSGAVIIPELKLEDLSAVYRVEYYAEDVPNSWFFPKVHIVEKFKNNCLFDKMFICHK